MKKYFLFSIIFLLSLTNCMKDKPVSKVHNFTKNTWKRFDFLNFDFPIENTDKLYNIVILLRFNDDFPTQGLLINLVTTMPSGEERIKEYKFTLRDKNDTLLGEKKAGYNERFITIKKDVRFSEQGVLKFEIENLMTKYFTPGIVEFGIVLEPAG